MIGNDVVDLRDPEARPEALHPRFDARVFAPEERDALARVAAPARLRWMLWAAKEAAYKVARKLDPQVGFSPRRFVVRLEDAQRGIVTHEGARLHLRLDVDAERVHALASEGPIPERELVRGCLRLGPEGPGASGAVRLAALRALAPLLGAPADQLAFVREGRVPRLRLRGAPVPVDVSLSHHGRFAAFAAVPAAVAAPGGAA